MVCVFASVVSFSCTQNPCQNRSKETRAAYPPGQCRRGNGMGTPLGPRARERAAVSGDGRPPRIPHALHLHAHALAPWRPRAVGEGWSGGGPAQRSRAPRAHDEAHPHTARPDRQAGADCPGLVPQVHVSIHEDAPMPRTPAVIANVEVGRACTLAAAARAAAPHVSSGPTLGRQPDRTPRRPRQMRCWGARAAARWQ